MIQEIKKLIESNQLLAKKAVDIYTPIVVDLIRSKTIDDNQIQLALDYMLSFCFDARMLLLYKKLCRYYWDINPQATSSYIEAFREMWEDEINEQLQELKP
jgi:hypothetical protein